ncbi:anthranilate synthase component ii [Trichoderma arundinaceum]|uniref:Anthranilate synthase component ii n=1 Tax=Trichoderma arundinaceum TaxID=490622 RepID=A0A395NAC8_TRIAR|nr:anthranilate synthase component ii [Trichoderma arundinaceum]
MPRVLRLAILECDTPFPKAKASRGSYGNIFQDLFELGLQNLGDEAADVQLHVSKWNVVAGNYPRLDESDAFVITGSSSAPFDDDPWIVALVAFVNRVLDSKEDKKVFGICFGHQIIGRALGADVASNPGGWELSVESIALSDQGQELFGLPSVELHQMHRDVVLTVPPGVTSLGNTTRCPIQILYKAGQVLSFQGHPEFDEPINDELLREKHVEGGNFDDEAFRDAIKRVDRPHDGVLLASRIMEFFLDRGKWQSGQERIRG